MKYNTNKGNHSIYCLQFHYVACIKYRRKILTNKISERLKEINKSVAEHFGIEIIEQETDKDHVHLLFSSKPQIEISKFVNSLKSVSARLLFREFPEIKKQLWSRSEAEDQSAAHGHLWSPSYFIATTGQVTLDILKKYVESQNE